MCGFAGFLTKSFPSGSSGENIALSMANTLEHRGPDSEGLWCDEAAGIALAHRRLSVLDISMAGHQPMKSSCSRYTVVFNGEIYNHHDVRQQLSSVHQNWLGSSDTETLLAAIATWGITQTLDKLVGMFAFAIWDKVEHELYLARDRMGEKPLYYGLVGEALVFGSELKALRSFPGFKAEIDRDVLVSYLSRSTVPGPFSIYQDIYKIPPGTWLKISKQDLTHRRLPLPQIYWSLADVAKLGQTQVFTGSEKEAENELDRLLRQSVSSQMLSDVPLGGFLSGGIDSSAICALMQTQSSRPIRSFTIGFRDDQYNEAQYARQVAAHLGTEHTELYIDPQQALRTIPKLPGLYDEPFADASQIPTFLLSQLARKSVTVCLSGDGGDELFGGYNRHIIGPKIWRKCSKLPMALRQAAARMLQVLSPQQWDGLLLRSKGILPRSWSVRTVGDKIHKISEMLPSKSPAEVYFRLVGQWSNPQHMVRGISHDGLSTHERPIMEKASDLEQQMMNLDTITYLPDDILVKLDRAAMGVSLETRLPMLDHRVVEFAWSLPLEMKIQSGTGKKILRRVLDRYIPRHLIDRPKSGFSVPIGSWLRGPLKDWAYELLNPYKMRHQGFFNPKPIQKAWQEHCKGARNNAGGLWNILMFQAWLEEQH